MVCHQHEKMEKFQFFVYVYACAYAYACTALVDTLFSIFVA